MDDFAFEKGFECFQGAFGQQVFLANQWYACVVTEGEADVVIFAAVVHDLYVLDELAVGMLVTDQKDVVFLRVDAIGHIFPFVFGASGELRHKVDQHQKDGIYDQ